MQKLFAVAVKPAQGDLARHWQVRQLDGDLVQAEFQRGE
jgi:hypothetical protein